MTGLRLFSRAGTPRRCRGALALLGGLLSLGSLALAGPATAQDMAAQDMAAASAPDLDSERTRCEGERRQGHLLTCRAAPGAAVVFQGLRIPVRPDGVFLIGFGRDDGPEVPLLVQWPDGLPETQIFQVAPRRYDIQRINGLASRMVTPPPHVLKRIKADVAAAKQARAHTTRIAYYETGFIWPVIGRITGVYGSQRILNGKPRQPHYGIDIAAPTGTPVRAPADGIVRLAHPDMYYSGKTLFIDHGYGLTSAFLHLSAITAEEGQVVRQGEIVAKVGSSGRSTGAHLDWRVNLHDQRLDAATLVGPMPKR